MTSGWSQGRVTSSYHSPTFGRGIAMALVERGPERMGETVVFPQPDGTECRAEIVDPVLLRQGRGASECLKRRSRGAGSKGSRPSREAAPRGMIALRGDLSDEGVRDAIASAGFAVPEQGMLADREGRLSLWMAPDEVLLVVQTDQLAGLRRGSDAGG